MKPTVLISGASIAGPALAYWLVRNGFEPTIVEAIVLKILFFMEAKIAPSLRISAKVKGVAIIINR